MVKAVNHAPTARVDTANVVVNKSVTINPLSNDTDVDGDSLTLVTVSSPRKGRVTKNGNSIIYTAGSSTGLDTLRYTVSDGFGGTATSTINVTITRR
jgi:large repetitive protein